MQRPITHLRHIALGVPDLAVTLAFYRDVWGLTAVTSDSGVAYLAAAGSPEPYVLRLREAEAKRVDVVAFGATDRLAVEALAAALGSSGVQIVAEPSELHTPGGGYGFRFFDNEGRTVEVSCDVATPLRDFDSRPAVPVALSHVVLNTPSPEDTVAFWETHLGFTVSDVLTMPHMGRLMWFMRCNNWHHSVAFVRCQHASLHHASYEMRSIDEYMYATGRAKRSGAELVWGPGRHLAGDNTFSYFLDPVGNTAEFTTALAEVDDDTWESHEYSIADPNVADQWGTAEAMSAELAAKSFNTPDAGLFSAPPVDAMFQYFPGNYVWNLSIAIAMESGAQIGEIDEMCAPLREAATGGADVGTGEFLARWEEMADRLSAQADDDISLGRRFSAGTKLHRAALYYQTAERMQPHGSPQRMQVFHKGQEAFRRAVEFGGDNLVRMEIPYEGGVIAGWFCRAEWGDGPRPTIIYINGLDSSKEMLVWTRLGRELARRGVSTLHIDQPGSGEALRVHGLAAVYDSERWAATVVDHLETIDDVDATRIGMVGISLGGYYAPRAVAFEPRLALGAVIGANHNWGEVQRQRLRREGENPVPHYWAHVQWVWGAADLDEFLAISDRVTLDGVLDRVRVPFLVTHGANDRQIKLEYAHRTYDQLVNSPKRELKVFDATTGSAEHAFADNLVTPRDFIADWIAETFARGGRDAVDIRTG